MNKKEKAIIQKMYLINILKKCNKLIKISKNNSIISDFRYYIIKGLIQEDIDKLNKII